MSVLVKIIGEYDGSDEYAAAKRLKQIIDSSIPQTSMGEIVLFPSATLYGQAVKDVDIMMIGNLRNYTAKVCFNHDGDCSEETVYLNSFCTTIEVKSHSISRVRKEGTNIQVFYNHSGWHNVTKQSNDQKISAMNFFKSALGESPYITNLIWFIEVNKIELESFLSTGNNVMPSNLIPALFSFADVVQQLAFQRIPWKNGNRYVIDCAFNGMDTDGVAKPLQLFSKAKTGMGELTRKKIEQISSAKLGEIEPHWDNNVLNILRGRAGTGKTIDLIKIAIKLVDELGARVQILTYNRALVSDIRRLFSLAELPDMFEEKCVSINTMQSFFYGLINECLYDGTLSGRDFLQTYPKLLQKMISFLNSDPEAKDIIRIVCEDNPKLNWEYILIDEAQDWSEQEKNLILLLYPNNRILVADGGQQFIRSIEPCDWTIVQDKNNIKLKYCLRQKRNLIKFINKYADTLYPSSNKIVCSEDLVGGKILLVKDPDKFFQTVKSERNDLLKAGNTAYDLLFIVPPSLVEGKAEDRHFALIKEFEQNGLLLWDGTNEDNRLEFSVDIEESRVLQYDSVRGLEGWTVCCMNFDEYMEMKDYQYNPDSSGNSLLLESAEEKKNKYLMNWALIPFTRAIDTLIITLKKQDSIYSKQLMELADRYPDYISVV